MIYIAVANDYSYFFRWVDEDLWLINPEMCLRLAAVRT